MFCRADRSHLIWDFFSFLGIRCSEHVLGRVVFGLRRLDRCGFLKGAGVRTDLMSKAVRVEREIGEETLFFESGFLAKQAAGSCLIGYGDTICLVAVTTGPPRPGVDFFPLTVDYRERVAAAGKFPGGFIKREGRPTIKETLTSRIIDRPIRPLFPKGFHDEVQIQCMVLSSDRQNDPDILAMNGSSMALCLSPLPFLGPIASVRVARIDGELYSLPTQDDLEESDLDMVVSGNRDAILMIEGFAREMPEDQMIEALATAHEHIRELCDLQQELIDKISPKKVTPEVPPENPFWQPLLRQFYEPLKSALRTEGKLDRKSAMDGVKERAQAVLISPEATPSSITLANAPLANAPLASASSVTALQSGLPGASGSASATSGVAAEKSEPADLTQRSADQAEGALPASGASPAPEDGTPAEAVSPLELTTAEAEPATALSEPEESQLEQTQWEGNQADQQALPNDPKLFAAAFHDLEEKVVRDLILSGVRSDGRAPEDLRSLYCEVNTLPRVHGSAVFQRGETQALVTVTLGTARDEQRIDGLVEEYSKKFMLDYYFPPFSVGETRPIRGPGRREIGHGMLAERSVKPVLPDPEVFPYTVRVISDILESNGSSSMATVCGATLGLMDAGVPILNPVAGISVGLVKEDEDNWILLTDIQGEEDHYGDMDFKVAGSQRGITGIQLDLKIHGISMDIIRATLEQARNARIHILRAMLTAIHKPRDETKGTAPRLAQTKINPDKIGVLIGPGGKTIRALQEETNTVIEVDDDGMVIIAADNRASCQEALMRVEALTESVQVGRIYKGRVSSVKDFGAFVEILPGKDGLCHISELADGYIRSVGDVCKVGDEIPVKVIAIDEHDRVKLSRKQALADLPDDEEPKTKAAEELEDEDLEDEDLEEELEGGEFEDEEDEDDEFE